MPAEFDIRPYRNEDLEAAISLWQRGWDAIMPEVDFGQRLEWWRERWMRELVPHNSIFVAERLGRLAGFVVIDRKTGWLDQIVVDPPYWGSGLAESLIEEAKRVAPQGINLDVNQSHERAVRFYERTGFVRTGEAVNPRSGAPTYLYAWKPGAKGRAGPEASARRGGPSA